MPSTGDPPALVDPVVEARPTAVPAGCGSGPGAIEATTRWNLRVASCAEVTYERHGSLSAAGSTFAPTGDRGIPTSTRPAHAAAPTPAAATIGNPTANDTAAPAPNRTMPSGDIIASAVRLVKNRSRKESFGIVGRSSEVGDHGGEHLVDRRRIARVVVGGAGGLGHRAQLVDGRLAAVGDREHPYRP